jgi:hypothetical protein
MSRAVRISCSLGPIMREKDSVNLLSLKDRQLMDLFCRYLVDSHLFEPGSSPKSILHFSYETPPGMC